MVPRWIEPLDIFSDAIVTSGVVKMNPPRRSSRSASRSRSIVSVHDCIVPTGEALVTEAKAGDKSLAFVVGSIRKIGEYHAQEVAKIR